MRERYFFVPFLFEDEVPPEIGGDAQLIVDRYMQVQNSYILVSMFWTRMGSPFTIIGTNERYESGTQYEFIKGYEHFQKTGQPHILLYRKHEENPKADPAQKQKVELFFDSFIGDPPKIKGLFTTYTKLTEFERKIEEHIFKIVEAYPPQPESSNWLEAPEFKEESRRPDAAMPRETTVGESTPIQVMICLPNSEGLRVFLPAKADEFEIKKRDVKAGGLTIAFPVDKRTGKVKPALVTIELTAENFRIKTDCIKAQITTGKDSGQITFNVIPLKPSRKSMVIVKVKSKALDGSEIECGSVVLYAKIKATKEQVALPRRWELVSRPLAAASKSKTPREPRVPRPHGLAGEPTTGRHTLPGRPSVEPYGPVGSPSLAGRPSVGPYGIAVRSVRAIRKGAVIRTTDVTLYPITRAVRTPEMYRSLSQVIGKVATQNIRVGTILKKYMVK